MAGNEVVHGVPERTRYEAGDLHEPPPAAQVPRDPEACRRSSPYALIAGTCLFHPDHRVGAVEPGMAIADLAADIALERGKAQCVLPLVLENELHAGGTETARAVVQE